MNAVVAGYSVERKKYLYKCPVCGVILENEEWQCRNCGTTISTYNRDTINMGEIPKVCVDLHGVTLDMLGALQVYLKDKYGVDFYPERVTDYDFDCDIGCDRSLVFAAFKDHELHKLIKPYDRALEAIALLKTRCYPQAYTSVQNEAAIIVGTNSFCRNAGLAGQAIVGKKPVIYDAVALFEDNVGVHRQWHEAGFRGLRYMVDRPYNAPKRDEPMWSRVIHVKSLYDGVVDLFKRFGWPIPDEVVVNG